MYAATDMVLNRSDLAIPHGTVAHGTIVAFNNANGSKIHRGEGIVIDLTVPQIDFSFGVPAEARSKGLHLPWPFPRANQSRLQALHVAADSIADKLALERGTASAGAEDDSNAIPDPLLTSGGGDSQNRVFSNEEALLKFVLGMPLSKLRNAAEIFDRTTEPVAGGTTGRSNRSEHVLHA